MDFDIVGGSDIFTCAGIVSAPLWDSQTSTYAGLLTVNDYLNVVRYYNLHAEKLKDVDTLLLSDLKGITSQNLDREMKR